MNDLDLDELRAIATNNGPPPTFSVYGPIEFSYGDEVVVEQWAVWDPEQDDPPGVTCGLEADAIFFAAFNRATVLALLDELEALREQ